MSEYKHIQVPDGERITFENGETRTPDRPIIGFIEGDGPFYKQPRREIRPRPQHDMTGRIYSVATSEESVESVAKLGDVRMIMFADRPWEMRAPILNRAHQLRNRSQTHKLTFSHQMDLPDDAFDVFEEQGGAGLVGGKRTHGEDGDASNKRQKVAWTNAEEDNTVKDVILLDEQVKTARNETDPDKDWYL